MNKKEKEEADKKQHILDAKNALKSLSPENKTDLSDKRWSELRATRESYLKEYIKFLETGDKEQISIDSKNPTPKDD